MFGEGRVRRQRTGTTPDSSHMKAAFAHLPPLVPAAVAVAVAISLTVFLLPGVGLQSGPTPLLTSLGGAAGRVAADLPAPIAKKRAPREVRTVSFSAQLVATRTAPVRQRPRAATSTHRVHPSAQLRVVRHAPVPAVQAPRPAAPAAPATTRTFFSSPGKTTGHGRGHGQGHGHSGAPKPVVKAPAPRAPGHGKAPGHSSGHGHGLAPGQLKKAPPGSPPAPAPPKANGGGNGHKGGKK